jgi:hypothetical protein
VSGGDVATVWTVGLGLALALDTALGLALAGVGVGVACGAWHDERPRWGVGAGACIGLAGLVLCAPAVYAATLLG